MLEEPATTMWLRTFREDRSFIKEYRGNAGELINEPFERGTYYLQVLTDAANPHRPDGTNIARLTFQGLAGATPSDAENQGEPVNLGVLTDAQPIRRRDALSFVIGRSRTFSPDLVKKDCVVGAESPTVVDTHDEFIFTAAPGLVLPEITGLSDMQNWNRGVPLNYFNEFNLTWMPVTGAIRHNGGQMKLRAGPLPDPTGFQDDAYVAYNLSISR
jgi:hypothetical protein